MSDLGRCVVVQIHQYVGEPLQGGDADDVAAIEQGVEDGVVDGAAVAFAEEVVLSTHHRGALGALDGVVVDVVSSVNGIYRWFLQFMVLPSISRTL